jgi:hypothetical protein
MWDRGLIGVLAATASLLLALCGAQAFDERNTPTSKANGNASARRAERRRDRRRR